MIFRPLVYISCLALTFSRVVTADFLAFRDSLSQPIVSDCVQALVSELARDTHGAQISGVFEAFGSICKGTTIPCGSGFEFMFSQYQSNWGTKVYRLSLLKRDAGFALWLHRESAGSKVQIWGQVGAVSARVDCDCATKIITVFPYRGGTHSFNSELRRRSSDFRMAHRHSTQ